MAPTKTTGTLAVSAVGTAGWAMFFLGLWNLGACEMHAKTYEACAGSRGEAAAWIMGGLGTQTGLRTYNPALRAKPDEDTPPPPDDHA